MNSRDYEIHGINFSGIVMDVLDVMAFTVLVMTVGIKVGLSVDMRFFWVPVKVIAAGYPGIRATEYLDKVLDEVRGLEK